jgi:hypothetical protein
MGAAVALEQSRSAPLLQREHMGEEYHEQQPENEEKRILMIQASANWHKMILHANEMKAQKEKDNSLQRVEESMALYSTTADGKDIQRSPSELSIPPLTPNISRVSSSPDLKLSPTSSSPKPKNRRQSSIQAMGAQFRREELERIRQEEEAAKSNSPTSLQKKSNKSHSPMKRPSVIDFDSLPPVRIDLKSRTSSSICLVWDMDFEALSSLQLLIDEDGNQLKPLYHLLYRKTKKESQLIGGLFVEQKEKWKFVCDDHDGTMIVVKDLQPNTSYTFRCCRRNWSSKWGPEINIRTGPGPPSCPIDIQPSEITSSSVLLTWLSPEKDNGLPILGYVLRMKPFGGSFLEIYRGKERVWIATNLQPNSLFIFEVCALNRAGEGPTSNRLAIRTLPEGATTMTPWVELVDPETNKIYFLHPKTKSTSWSLPTGAFLDRKKSFQNKLQYFYANIRKLTTEARHLLPYEKHSVKLYLSRDNLVEDTLRQLRLPTPHELLAGPIRVTFHDEEGIDGGGLSREWAVEVMKLILLDSSGLMTISGNSGEDNEAILDIRANAFHGSDCRWLFLSLGKLLAKVIIDELAVGVKFSDLFLTWLCGRLPTLEDLKSIDSTMFRGLEWVLHNPINETDLTFSASYDLLGTTEVIDFLPNGKNLIVTEENKVQYVDLMMAWLIQGRYEPALTHFLHGFHSLIPVKYLEIFHLHELQYLISGEIEIDINQLMATTCYTGLIFPTPTRPPTSSSSPSSSSSSMPMLTGQSLQDPGDPHSPLNVPIIRWFWNILKEMDLEMLPQLLAFITGCSSLPSCGLKPPLTITILDDDAVGGGEGEGDGVGEGEWQRSLTTSTTKGLLPVAHTCFNQIVLPNYDSEEILREKLLYAIRNTGQGFHLK